MSRARLAQLAALYDEHHGGMSAVLDKVAAESRAALTPDEETQLRTHQEVLDRIGPELEALTTVQARSNQVSALYAGAGSWPGGFVGDAEPDAIPRLMPSPGVLQEMVEFTRSRMAGQQSWEDLQLRAVVTTSGTGTVTGELSASPLPEPRRIATAVSLPVEEVAGIGSSVFPIFGDADSADIVAENATKPEYDAVTSGTATPAVIALWTDHTRQVSETILTFDQRLRAKLAARIARREDVLLAARVLAASGIQTHTAGAGESPGDALLGAAAKVLASDVNTSPDLALINPADVVAIFGDAVGSSGESPRRELVLDLHGMRCYVTSAVSAGAAIVGAWRASSHLVVGMRPRVLVDTMSGLKNNRVTTLMEEAVTLAVTEPAGFVSVDLTPA